MFKKSLIIAITILCFNASQCHANNDMQRIAHEALTKEKLDLFRKDLDKVKEQEEILLNNSSTQLSHSKICFYTFLAGLGLCAVSFLIENKDIHGKPNGGGDGLWKAGVSLAVAAVPAGGFTAYTEQNKLAHCEQTRQIIYKNINDLK
jgi:hypothetical protein